jgi:hypothetical protein
MSIDSVKRMKRSVRALPATPSAATPVIPEPQLDAAQLAREAAHAFDRDLAEYRRLGELEGPPDPRQPPPGWREQNARTKPPEDVTFGDIERLGRIDPAAATARWEEVKAAARNDLDSGWLAARALEYLGGSAWERACFSAVRDRLRRAWVPRHPGEAVLIDQMAQYEVLRQQWVRVLHVVSHEPRTIIELNAENRPPDRKLGSAGATLEAARMVERMQRLYQSALRTLLGLRRTAAAVTVRNSGPMNLALGPQLNVTAPAAEPDPQGPVVRVDAPG